MLEAFQRSAQADEARQAGAETAGRATPSEAGVGGPFAAGGSTTAGQASGPAGPLLGDPARARAGEDLLGIAPARSRGLDPRVVLLVAGLLIAMVVTFFLGRDFGSANSVGAGDESALLDELERDLGRAGADTSTPLDPPRPPAAAKESQLTADDQAFLDKRNDWTVIAISFDNNQSGGERALATYRYLREQGLPAVAPITQGKYLSICVGAQPSRNGAIENIRSKLQRLAGPPPRNESAPFASAYFANIKDLIDPGLRH
jgi:hypothetical protein